jgi:hypothetical protein
MSLHEDGGGARQMGTADRDPVPDIKLRSLVALRRLIKCPLENEEADARGHLATNATTMRAVLFEACLRRVDCVDPDFGGPACRVGGLCFLERSAGRVSHAIDRVEKA